MGRHKEWRKVAKRERRRRLRVEKAVARDNPYIENTIEYTQWLLEQEALEKFEMEQIEINNKIENEKWLKAEKAAILVWQTLQQKLENEKLKKAEDEKRKRMEWELEQEKIKEAEEKLRQLEEEKKKNHEQFIERLESFLQDGSKSPPPELLTTKETKPNTELCPFFAKTACCRFGDDCSRNHQYCGISRVLLVSNFYAHFGLENSNFNEYDTDLMLEYEDSDQYKHFKDFYYDVLPEVEKFGNVIQFKVCNNLEKHLRGNTYIEYEELRAAVTAYRSLHGRWYGGRQMSIRFCEIQSWKNAICGLQSSKRCPKGRTCNFLHVFKNPESRFENYRSNNDYVYRYATRKTTNRSWRWSESPEVEIRDRERSVTEYRRSCRSPRSERSNRPDSARSHRRRASSPERSKRKEKRKYRSRSRTPKKSERRKRSRSHSSEDHTRNTSKGN